MPLPNRSLTIRTSDGSAGRRLTPLGVGAVPAPAPADGPSTDGPLVDVAQLRALVGFPLRAAGRHRRTCAWLAAGVLAAAALAAAVLPRTYHVESRILAQKNVVMSALGNPKRAVPSESDAPTRLAAEAVMSRENLIDIVRETNLLAHERAIRSPLGRLKQALVERTGRRPATEAERVDALLEVLHKRMWVTGDDAAEGTVTIGIDWPDPRTGLAIATAAQDHFLESRHTTEVSRIGESIAILERYVEGARAVIDSTLAEAASLPRRPGAAPIPVAGLTRTAGTANPVVAGLQASLATRRAEIEDLVASRETRMTALRKQLADLQRDYGPAHPEVQAAEQSIAALGADSPQLQSLRAEAQTLRGRLATLRAPETPAAPATGADAALARAALERLVRADSVDDPRLTYAQSRLKIAITDYEDLLSRLESARIELETARAAFKYRYRIVSPPQLPKRAVKPSVPMLLGVGGVLAVALALFAATALDLAGGRVLEGWQVERQVGLPLLGDVERP